MIDENLVIVQPAEHLLHPFQRAQLLRALQAARLDVELEAVAQLLERDPRRVQPLGQVDRSGRVDGVPQRERPPADTRVERPAPGAARLGILRALELADGTVELAHDSTEGGRRLLGGHFRACLVPRGARRLANQPQRGLGETARFVQLGYQEQHDVRLADAPKPPRHLTQLV